MPWLRMPPSEAGEAYCTVMHAVNHDFNRPCTRIASASGQRNLKGIWKCKKKFVIVQCDPLLRVENKPQNLQDTNKSKTDGFFSLCLAPWWFIPYPSR